jgi:hypothetical protein
MEHHGEAPQCPQWPSCIAIAAKQQVQEIEALT